MAFNRSVADAVAAGVQVALQQQQQGQSVRDVDPQIPRYVCIA